MDDFTRSLSAIVGPLGTIDDPAAMAPYCEEERGLYHGRARLVVRPATTAELADVVRLCAESGVPIVPQGGNTGLCGGAVPAAAQPPVLISLQRLNRIRATDPVNFVMTVEAGVILETIQRAAETADCFFPLSLGAEGSCQIGGNISTNAGGTGVLRYGNTRELVLGLEVVLPDGRVWDGLRSLRKDNTGYDLKQLFIGGEGTLGIISAAVIKLFPQQRDIQTAFCALPRLDAALALLKRARSATGDQVTAFELVPRIGIEMVRTSLPDIVDPFTEAHDWYVLIELATSQANAALRDVLEALLGAALEADEIADAVVAGSLDQRRALWRLREGIPEAQKRQGGSIKHDVSVPVSCVPDFIRAATRAVIDALPDVRVVPFGHVGDGNIHFNLSQPVGGDKSDFLARWPAMNRLVHDIADGMRGSISAEHGIGVLKKDEMLRYKAPIEIDLMRRIKAALDPQGIMNPGKML